MHQNESQGATSIAAAKAIYSQAVLEAKTNFRATVMEAKITRCHSIQAAEAACSKAISDTEAHKASQAMMFQEEHSKYLESLEEQAFGEESRSHNEVLSTCQAALCHSPQPLRGYWLPHITFYWDKTSIPSPCSASEDSLCRRTVIYSCSPYANTQTVSKTKKAASFTRANGEHAPGWSHPSGYIRGTSPSQEVREPSLVQVAKAQPC